MADVQDTVEDELAWDLRALSVADRITDEQVARAGVAFSATGLYPSLHISVAEDYRKLGDLDRARKHLQHARDTLGALADDDYGQLIRSGFNEVADRLHEPPHAD
ncbi:hypothetical protein ACI2LF_14885 [Kribbella sp. NPDC020789]